MSDEPSQLLVAWRKGDKKALDQLVRVLYDELHKMARRQMRRERAGHTLQTAALLNEAYLRLMGYQQVSLQNRAHFLAIAAQTMRRVLVDHARARLNAKRGGGIDKIEIDDGAVLSPQKSKEIVALEEALSRLEAISPRRARVVEMRYFGGLSVEETAEVLDVSAITVMREWKAAKAWLYEELKPSR